MATDKLIRLTPQNGKVPRVSLVRDGTIRVYFTPTQDFIFDEPPGYTAPAENDYPQAGTLMRRPQTLRLTTCEGNGGDLATGNETTRTFFSVSVEGQPNVDVLFCSCQDGTETVQVTGLEGGPYTVAISNLTTAYLNALVFPIFGSNIFSSSSDSAVPGCTCPNSSSTPGHAGNFRAAVETIVLPDRVGTLQADSLSDTDYLAAVSVAVADVPTGNATTGTWPFIGGEVMTVFLFGNDTCKDKYTAATVAASDAGVRIIAAYSRFKKFKVMLCVDTQGSVGSAFKTQLADIATELADYGFEYHEVNSLNAEAELASLVSGFFTE